jgi:quercetin dioxygenase-like cupin family protein
MRLIRTRPESTAGPADWFTGTVWMDQIAAAAAPSTLHALSVHFTPGSRTAWHEHPRGQILHVLEGAGRIQSRGGAVEEIRAGDTVVADAGEWHWHGAGPGTFMTHLALQEAGEDGAHAHWGDHVSDEEYRSG